MLDLGILSPREVSIAEHPDANSRALRKGMAGWVVCGMKNPKDGVCPLALLLSRHEWILTVTCAPRSFPRRHVPPDLAPDPPARVVQAPQVDGLRGDLPARPGRLHQARGGDPAPDADGPVVTSNRESSTFLGQGFRLGFNGSLHMDVFRQRLEDEFGEEVIVTRPLVPVKRASASSLLAALPLGGSPVLPAPFVRHAAQSRSRTARSARSTTRLTSPTRVACSRWSGSRSP